MNDWGSDSVAIRRRWPRALIIALILLWPASAAAAQQASKPKRAILLIIDGLHWQAPEGLGLRNLQQLAQQGAYIRRAHLLAPFHPTTGDWARLHTCSIPNPVMLAGTLFVRPGQRLVQDCFFPKHLTAHVANCDQYGSINRSNSFSFLHNTTDSIALEHALDLLARHDIRFMRIHLQDTGNGGWECYITTKEALWRRDIWADGSPYVAAAREADSLLARLIAGLKRLGKWEDTLLVVTADHGNAPTGAHPRVCEDAWITPLWFVGPGVARGRQFDYAEHLDIVPTICELMGVEPPNRDGGSGRVLDEIFADRPLPPEPPVQRLRQVNELNRRFELTRARLLLLSEQNPALAMDAELADDEFLSLLRFTRWRQAGSIDELIARNRRVVEELERCSSRK